MNGGQVRYAVYERARSWANASVREQVRFPVYEQAWLQVTGPVRGLLGGYLSYGPMLAEQAHERRSGGARALEAGRPVKSQVYNHPVMRAWSLVLTSKARPVVHSLRLEVLPWVEDSVLKVVQARAWAEAGR